MVNTRKERIPHHQPNISRDLEKANDVEKNPGPKSPTKSPTKGKGRKSRSVSRARKPVSPPKIDEGGNETDVGGGNSSEDQIQDDNSITSTASSQHIEDKLTRLAAEVAYLQSAIDIVDDKIGRLNGQVDELRPLYNEAKVALGSQNAANQKNNLIFWGLEPDNLEMDMNGDPDFCRDILETRVKGILRENLKISRDLSFLHVARMITAKTTSGPKPVIACFANWKDKENVLRQAKLLKGSGISITEDASLKDGKLARRASKAKINTKINTGGDNQWTEIERKPKPKPKLSQVKEVELERQPSEGGYVSSSTSGAE